jgi:leader peptidase (prepilin peptidase) / N-methyltransferase
VAAPLALLLLLWPIGEDTSAKLPPAALFALYGLATLTLLLIFVTDLEHHLILDVVTYPAIIGLLALGIGLNHQMLFFMVVGALIAGALFGVCYALAYLIYHTDALGLGDVKLAVLMGLLIGWPAIINALFYGTLAGAATGIILMIARRADRHTMIPLGTGLSLGAFLALLLAPLLW